MITYYVNGSYPQLILNDALCASQSIGCNRRFRLLSSICRGHGSGANSKKNNAMFFLLAAVIPLYSLSHLFL